MEDTAARLGKQRDAAVLKAAGAAVASRLLTSLTAVLTLAIAARSLSAAQLGVVAVLTTLVVFLGFGDFGLGTLLMTRLPAANARGDDEGKKTVVEVTLSTLCVTGLLVVAAGGASAYLLPWPALLGAKGLDASGVRLAVLVFFGCGGLSIPATVGARVYAAMQRSAVLHVWNAVAGVLTLITTTFCAVFGTAAWTYVFALAGVPMLVGLLETYWALTRAFPELRPRTLLVRPALAVAFLRSGALFAVLTISTVISYNIDSLVVSSVLGASAAAVFTVASRIFVLVGGTLSLAGQQMWSSLADAIGRGDIAWARSRYRRALVASTSVNGVVCLVLVVIGRWLSRFWVGGGLVPPLSLLIVLAIYTVYSTTVIQASYLLAAIEKVKALAIAGMIMAPVNLVLSVLLTRRYGLTGPVLGSIIALAVVLTGPVVWLTWRQFAALGQPVTITGGPAAGRHRYRAPKRRRRRRDVSPLWRFIPTDGAGR
ncbi:MAG TPA: lipopolysaccharide biosynthesis protein [Jatrophihabitantaceae bacterium]|nr:lipopolysaccharide biosynthesis protein [Jatrophihabitantaceae bacterium]